MTPNEFHQKLTDFLSEVAKQELTFPEQTQFIGISEYALFAWKLSLAQSIARRHDSEESKPDDHFGA